MELRDLRPLVGILSGRFLTGWLRDWSVSRLNIARFWRGWFWPQGGSRRIDMFPEMEWESLMASVDEFWTEFRDQFLDDSVLSSSAVQGVADFTKPVGAMGDSGFLAPLIGVAGLLAGLLLTGVALGALGALLGALLALGFLLVRVYGVTFEINPFVMPSA